MLSAIASSPPWNDTAPVREELFSVERLEQHAESLAAAQPVTKTPPTVLSLHARLNDNAAVLLSAYRATAAELESGRGVVPAAEWLLDNYHLVEEQIREIRDDLPPGYYRQLPKLAEGPFAGYPRVFGLAWAFVAHTDSHFDPDDSASLHCRLSARPTADDRRAVGRCDHAAHRPHREPAPAGRPDHGRTKRACEMPTRLADRLLAIGLRPHPRLETDIATRSSGPLVRALRRTAGEAAEGPGSPNDAGARLAGGAAWGFRAPRSTSAVQHAQQRQGASNVTVRNIITSMRLISDIDWAELFESVSLVDERLRAASNFAAMDFPTRNLYRSAIEQLARGSACSELEIADHALEASRARRRPQRSVARKRSASAIPATI